MRPNYHSDNHQQLIWRHENSIWRASTWRTSSLKWPLRIYTALRWKKGLLHCGWAKVYEPNRHTVGIMDWPPIQGTTQGLLGCNAVAKAEGTSLVFGSVTNLLGGSFSRALMVVLKKNIPHFLLLVIKCVEKAWYSLLGKYMHPLLMNLWRCLNF